MLVAVGVAALEGDEDDVEFEVRGATVEDETEAGGVPRADEDIAIKADLVEFEEM